MSMMGVGGAPVAGLGGFTIEERDRRWQVVRTLMDAQGIDLLLLFPQFVPGDAVWIANQPGAVIFPRDGEPQILLGGEDSAIERERPPGWIADRRFVGLANGVHWGDAVARQLQDMDLDRQTIGIAGMAGDNYILMHNPEGYLNYTTIKTVIDSLPSSCAVVNGTPIMSRARYVKSDEEIAVLEESVRHCEIVADVIQDQFREGRPQAEAFINAMTCLTDHGKLANFGWCPGKWGEPRPRLVGPPPGIIEADLYLSVEIVVPSGNYAAQIAQAYVVGEPNEEAQRLLHVNELAFAAARKAMQPGATWNDVIDATNRAAEGTGCWVQMIMHGMGSGPLITPFNSHEAVKDDLLVESSTFILKPCAVPDGKEWFARSMDVSWGDMVVVRPGGAQRLGSRPFSLLQTA